MDWMSWAGLTLAASGVGLLASVIFLVAYLRKAGADAWRNPFGRYLISRKALLAVLFLTIILNRVQPHWWWDSARVPVTALLMTAFAVQTFWPYRLLLKAQEEAQRMEEDSRS